MRRKTSADHREAWYKPTATAALRWSRGRPFGLILLVVLLVARATVLDTPLQRMQLLTFDTYQRFAPRQRESAPVVIVAIDEKSLSRFGQWPWPRTLLARLVDEVGKLEPAAIGLDVFMPEQDRCSPHRLADSLPPEGSELANRLRALPDSEQVLARAISDYPVSLGVAGLDSNPTPDAPPHKVAVLGRFKGGDPSPYLQSYSSIAASYQLTYDAARGHGLLNAEQDVDGTVRRLPLVGVVGGTLVPSLTLDMIRLVVGATTFTVQVREGYGVEGVIIRELVFKTARDGTYRVHFSHHDMGRYVSAADVLDGKVGLEEIQRKLVLIGVTGIGIVDFPETPVEKNMPGVEVHAQLLENLFDGARLHPPEWANWAEGALLAVFSLVLIAAIPTVSPRLSPFIFVGLVGFVEATGWLAYTQMLWLLDVGWVSTGLTVMYLSTLGGSLVDSMYERRRLERALARESFLAELTGCTEPDDLSLRVGERLVEFLKPASCVIYARAGNRFAPVFSRGESTAERFDASGPIVAALQAHDGVVELRQEVGSEGGLPLDAPVEGRRMDRLHAAIALPICRRSVLFWFICLGPKRSGRAYTPGDITLLGTIAERVSSELLRFDEHKLAAIGESMARMMHDMRNPLTAAAAYTEILSDADTLERKAKAVETMRVQFKLMERMVGDVLAFARGESRLLVTEVQTNGFLERLRKQIEPEMEHGKVDLVIRAEYGGIAYFDEVSVTRAISNLARNACEAMPEGGTFTIAVQRRDDHLILELSDTGAGIPAEMQDRLFTAFATAGKQGGTGLGLTTVKKVVDDHNGTIAVESAEGAGTTFTIELPIGTPAVEAETPTAIEVTHRPVAVRRHPTSLRVLVVDDDPFNTMVAVEMLNELGHKSDTAVNGREALETLRRESYDVITMDMHMPEMDGPEAARRICAEWSTETRPWIVAVTGADASDEREVCRAAGMDGYLSKPFSLETLQAALQQCRDR